MSCASAAKHEYTANFFFIKIFHSFSIGKKERGKWKKTTWNVSCEKKKLERRTKQKKIKLTNKRNTVVLRTSKYENKDDGD